MSLQMAEFQCIDCDGAGCMPDSEGGGECKFCCGVGIVSGFDIDHQAAHISALEAERDAARAEVGRLREALGKFDALWGIKLESESREELQALSDAFKYARAALAAKGGGG